MGWLYSVCAAKLKVIKQRICWDTGLPFTTPPSAMSSKGGERVETSCAAVFFLFALFKKNSKQRLNAYWMLVTFREKMKKYCLNLLLWSLSLFLAIFPPCVLIAGHPDSSTHPHHPGALWNFQTDVISADFLFETHGSICASSLQSTEASQLRSTLTAQLHCAAKIRRHFRPFNPVLTFKYWRVYMCLTRHIHSLK